MKRIPKLNKKKKKHDRTKITLNMHSLGQILPETRLIPSNGNSQSQNFKPSETTFMRAIPMKKLAEVKNKYLKI